MSHLDPFQLECEQVLDGRLSSHGERLRNRIVVPFSGSDELCIGADAGRLHITIFSDGVSVIDKRGHERRFELLGSATQRDIIDEVWSVIATDLGLDPGTRRSE